MTSQKRIDQIWEKGKQVRGGNPEVWRKDIFGNLIRKASYGTVGRYAWEFDHKNPKARGGSDHLRNMQPLDRDANRVKSDKYPCRRR